jgi:hypothetical protein
MKVLKLCTSDEFSGDLPDALRAYRVAERLIAETTGEPVETILKPIWPDPELPHIVDGWMERHHPDLVLLVVSAYWMTFESVPLRLERTLGVVGRWLGRAAERAVAADGVGETAAMVKLRGAARRLIGADAAFSPQQVTARMEECIRVILKHEDAGLVVRAPLVALVHHQDERGRARGELRLLAVDTPIRALCQRLQVEYVVREQADPSGGAESRFNADFVHTGEQAHRDRGLAEGAALARAWQQAHTGSLTR